MALEEAQDYRAKAEQIRRLALEIDDPAARAALEVYAEDLEKRATELEAQAFTSKPPA